MKADIRKREIVYCDLGEPQGHLQSGARPCVIVSNAIHCRYGSTIHVIPLTTKTNKTSIYHAYIAKNDTNHLKADCLALVEDMVCINKEQAERHVGYIAEDSDEWKDITNKIQKYFS